MKKLFVEKFVRFSTHFPKIISFLKCSRFHKILKFFQKISVVILCWSYIHTTRISYIFYAFFFHIFIFNLRRLVDDDAIDLMWINEYSNKNMNKIKKYIISRVVDSLLDLRECTHVWLQSDLFRYKGKYRVYSTKIWKIIDTGDINFTGTSIKSTY